MNAGSGQARAVVWVGGHVQGVGFRWWAAREASRLGLVGSAENLYDGRVRLDLQGRPEDVDAMVALAVSQPGPASRPGRVATTLVDRPAPDPALRDFRAL